MGRMVQIPAGAVDGDLLRYDAATGRMVAYSPTDLVRIPGAITDGQILAYDAATAAMIAENAPTGGGATVGRDQLTAATGNNTLTLGATPVTASALVWKNGALLWPGVDYTISGAVVTFGAALSAGDLVEDYYLTTGTPGTAALSTAGGSGSGVIDTFNRADSSTALGTTSDGNATWTTRFGTLGIAGNQAYAPAVVSGTPPAGGALATVDAATAGTVQIDVPTVDTGCAGVVFRYVDDSNHWRVVYGSGGATADATSRGSGLYRVAAGSIDLWDSLTVPSGATIQVVYDTTGFTVEVNGSTVLTGAGSAYSANSAGTGVGLFADATGFRLDNFSFTP